MITRILSFDGFALNTDELSSYGAGLGNLPDAKHVFVDQINAEPSYAGAYTVAVRTVAIEILLSQYEGYSLLLAELAEALRPGKEGTLIAMFDDENRAYQMDCKVVSFTPDEKAWNQVTVVFNTEETAWRTVDEVSASAWSITASGQTKTLSVGGYSETRLSMDLTATGLPATGWAYRQPYQLVNKPGYRWGMRAWCYTLNTAALVTAGKMLSTCYDVRVIVDGKNTNRWIASPNTSATKIWFNVNQEEGQSLTLGAAIASSGGITRIYFKKTSDNKAKLKKINPHGYFVHGTEWIEYDSVNVGDYYVHVKGRGVFGTTLQAHSVGDSMDWMEHSILILYGHASATSPDANDAHYDDTKPIFDLVNSDNGQYKYTTTTGFYDEDHPKRPGQFKPFLSRVGNVSDWFAIYNSSLAANTGLGMKMASWYKGGKIQSEKATIGWVFSWPGLINNVSMTGQKYRSTANWAGTSAVRLEYSNDQNKWFTSWSEGTPASALTQTAITKNSQSTNNAKYVRFALTGTLPASESENDFEVLTCTIDMVDGSNPTGTALAEQENIMLDLAIINQTNGDTINFYFPVRQNKPLSLDGEENEATLGSGTNLESAQAAISLDDDSREVWMRLDPGDNVLEVSADVIQNMTANLHWYERRLL